ncbi:MAG: DsbA family protein [Candidatus Limnocylindria bacterium]
MSRLRLGPAEDRRRQTRRRLLLIGVGIAALLIVAALALRPTVPDVVSAGGGDTATTVTYAAPVLGDPRAPVTIVEYADFQCPSCGAFARGTEPEIIKRYIDTGKAKLVWKNFAWIGSESKAAAQAAACAGDQNRFWEYHDYLYSHQRGENLGAFAAANLKTFAGAIGLDHARFDGCLDSGRYKAAVDADFSEVRSLNFTGTPTFLINGTRIVGPTASQMFALIDQKLAGK